MNLEDRISRYVAKLDPSVSGQNGHNTLFLAAGKLVSGWALSDEEALPFLFEFNSRCAPPWSTSELKRKLKEARKKQSRYKHPIGHLRGKDIGVLPKTQTTEEPYVPPQKPYLIRFRKGYAREFQQMQEKRGWSIPALKAAEDLGVLRFGNAARQACWIVRDGSGICAEARRLDDKLFPPFKNEEKDLPERKAHSILHSDKRWPLGIQIPADPLYSVCMFEGAPDLLSGYHFRYLQGRNDVVPTAMLGKGMAQHGFHPDSWNLLRGRRVRIFPHNDVNGDGLRKALHWANELLKLECKVDFFVFEDVLKPDGTSTKDLSECVGLNLEDLFP